MVPILLSINGIQASSRGIVVPLATCCCKMQSSHIRVLCQRCCCCCLASPHSSTAMEATQGHFWPLLNTRHAKCRGCDQHGLNFLIFIVDKAPTFLRWSSRVRRWKRTQLYLQSRRGLGERNDEMLNQSKTFSTLLLSRPPVSQISIKSTPSRRCTI